MSCTREFNVRRKKGWNIEVAHKNFKILQMLKIVFIPSIIDPLTDDT